MTITPSDHAAVLVQLGMCIAAVECAAKFMRESGHMKTGVEFANVARKAKELLDAQLAKLKPDACEQCDGTGKGGFGPEQYGEKFQHPCDECKGTGVQS